MSGTEAQASKRGRDGGYKMSPRSKFSRFPLGFSSSMDVLPKFPGPQFPHLKNGDNSTTTSEYSCKDEANQHSL
jgi:hypothetical protein